MIKKIFIFCFFLNKTINCFDAFQIYTVDNDGTQINVYNKQVFKEFTNTQKNNPLKCLSPKSFYTVDSDKISFYLQNNNDQSLFYVTDFKIFYDREALDIYSDFANPVYLQIWQDQSLNLLFFCNEETIRKNKKVYLSTFSIVKIQFEVQNVMKLGIDNQTEVINFEFRKICNNVLYGTHFDLIYLVLIILTVISVAFFARNSQIVSFQKRIGTIPLNLKTSCIMFPIYFAIAFSETFLWDEFLSLFKIIVIMLLLVCLYFVFEEIFISIIGIKRKKYGFKVFFLNVHLPYYRIISMLLALVLSILWSYYKNALTNDICCFLVMLSLFKIFKVNSLKDGMFFIAIVYIIKIVDLILFYFSTLDYSIFDPEYFLPLRIECITLQNYLDFNCRFINSIDIFFPGIFISYFHRYDVSNKINAYFLISIIGFILVYSSHSLAYFIEVSYFSFPFVIIFSLGLSYLRNEHFVVWNGLFFDQEIYLPEIKNTVFTDEEYYQNKNILEGLSPQNSL